MAVRTFYTLQGHSFGRLIWRVSANPVGSTGALFPSGRFGWRFSMVNALKSANYNILAF